MIGTRLDSRQHLVGSTIVLHYSAYLTKYKALKRAQSILLFVAFSY